MAFVYISNDTYAAVYYNFFYYNDTWLEIYWDGVEVYNDSYYDENSNEKTSVVGTDGATYNIGSFQDSNTYTYTTTTYSTSTYTSTLEFYSVERTSYIEPDVLVTATWPSTSLAYDATSFTVNISGDPTDTTYRITAGGTVYGSRKDTGNIVVTAVDLPPLGATQSYALEAVVLPADGGSGIPQDIEYEQVTRDPRIIETGTGTADYGLELYNSSGTKTLTVGDTAAFISSTVTTSISNSSSSGTINLTATGARTTDYAVALLDFQSAHALNCTVTSTNNVRVDYDLVKASASGSTTYTIYVYNLGD